MEGADCALAIRYQGSLFVAWGVEVAPREGTVLGTGVLPGCDDGTGASPDEALQVAELRGASPEVAVVWQGRTDVVFVRDGVPIRRRRSRSSCTGQRASIATSRSP